MKRFWNWTQTDSGRDLFLEGVIAEEIWWGDEVTPAQFKSDLMAGNGPVCVHINSPGGDCVAASMIYTMLKEYADEVTVKIDGMAASAASVIAMAGNKVLMSPTSIMMIHNPFTIAMGDSDEMRKAIQLLDEVKEAIINAYEIKTGMSRTKLAHLMDAETWMSAHTALDMGFCDEVMFEDKSTDGFVNNSFVFSRRAVTNCLLDKLQAKASKPVEPVNEEKRVMASALQRRLALLRY